MSKLDNQNPSTFSRGSINSPEVFIDWAIENGWQEGLQIDRIDNNKGYQPSNCRFVSHAVNQSNKRARSNTGIKYIHYNTSRESYQIRLNINGESKYFGSFSNLGDAKIATVAAIERRERT